MQGCVDAGIGDAGMQATHMVQQRWESRPQLRAQQPHWGLGSQQELPQSSQSRAHQPGVTLAQCTQERGQQRTHMPHLQGAETSLVGTTPSGPHPPHMPLTSSHLAAAERQVPEAQQAQPTHSGLRVILPTAQSLQDRLFPQQPRRGPALQ